MKKKKLIALIILLLSISLNAQKKFKIHRENKTSNHELGLNKYSFVHHVCPDSFFMTELYHNLNYDEMANIIQNIYKGVTNKDKVQVLYKEVEPTTAKITYSVQNSSKLGIIFVMFTNFNNATRKFDKKPDPKDQLVRWYYIKDDRLIYRKDLYSFKTEQVKLNSKRKSDIIKYYLFDNNSDNDNQIKPLIDGILEKEDNGPDHYFARIYQIQYYLMNNQIQKAGDALNSLHIYFDLNTDIPRNQKIYLLMVNAEYEVMKRI